MNQPVFHPDFQAGSFFIIPLASPPVPSVQCGPLWAFLDYKGEIMNKLIAGVMGGVVALQATSAFANVSEGPPDYSGITGLYYTLIALILGFGVYDTFFKKS